MKQERQENKVVHYWWQWGHIQSPILGQPTIFMLLQRVKCPTDVLHLVQVHLQALLICLLLDVIEENIYYVSCLLSFFWTWFCLGWISVCFLFTICFLVYFPLKQLNRGELLFRMRFFSCAERFWQPEYLYISLKFPQVTKSKKVLELGLIRNILYITIKGYIAEKVLLNKFSLHKSFYAIAQNSTHLCTRLPVFHLTKWFSILVWHFWNVGFEEKHAEMSIKWLPICH